MWNLIPRKENTITRIARYCCDVLKEGEKADLWSLVLGGQRVAGGKTVGK